MKAGKILAKRYGIKVRNAYTHYDGNWYWNLNEFPGAYFDADGYILFGSEQQYRDCVYLSIGPRNTGIRNKNVGMTIADIPGYKKLNPPPRTL